MPSIWKSRKFWLTVADVVFSTAVYFVTKYIAPETGTDILWLIGAYQPVVIMLITAYTVQNTEAMKSGK